MRPGRCDIALVLALLPGISGAWDALVAPAAASSAQLGVSELPGRFSVVSWNVHKETDSVFTSELGALLDSTSADLVLLQECVHPGGSRLDSALEGRAWALSANLRTGASEAATGVLTASSSLQGFEAMLSRGGEPLLGTRKPMLATLHRAAGGPLLAINLHALNFSLGVNGFRQQLGDVAKVAASHAGPVLVAGDFNTWSARRLRVADSVLGAASLVRLDFGDAERDKRRAFGRPLDQIYYDPRRLRPVPGASGVPLRFRSSDHPPLVAGFEMVRDQRPAE